GRLVPGCFAHGARLEELVEDGGRRQVVRGDDGRGWHCRPRRRPVREPFHGAARPVRCFSQERCAALPYGCGRRSLRPRSKLRGGAMTTRRLQLLCMVAVPFAACATDDRGARERSRTSG